jgi:hypothetical protein
VAMTGGTLRAGTSVLAKGTYPPPGDALGDLRDARVSQTASVEVTPLEFGTGAGKIDHLSVSDHALAAGASLTFDLYAGTDLLDLVGFDAAFRNVKFVQVSILSGGDASGVRVGGAAADEWVGYFAAAGDRRDIFPGGPPFVDGSPAGVAVTSSAKNLKVENLGAAAATLRVVVAGSASLSGSPMGLLLALTYP